MPWLELTWKYWSVAASGGTLLNEEILDGSAIPSIGAADGWRGPQNIFVDAKLGNLAEEF